MSLFCRQAVGRHLGTYRPVANATFAAADHDESAPLDGLYGNPTQEQIADLKRKHEEFITKSRQEGQKRLAAILDRHRSGWHNVELVAPYWQEGEGLSSTVIVTNTFSRAVDVTPAVYTTNGQAVTGRTFRVRANDSLDLPLREAFDDLRGSGHIALRYHGETQEITALVVIGNIERSISVDHVFEQASDFGGTEFEGLLFMPNAAAIPQLALSNVSNSPVTVSVAVPAKDPNEKDATRELTVGPRQTEMVALRAFLGGFLGYPAASRVRVSHSGKPGDVRLHGMVTAPGGFSANIRLMEPTAIMGDKLFSPILPLAEVTTPIAVLANTNARDATIHVDAYYSANGAVQETSLRTVTIPAHGALSLDLAGELAALPPDAANIGLTFDYYAAGGILADVLLVDQSGSGVYQVSPKGYTSHGHTSHSFPIRLEGDLNTIITVANPSETKELTYSLNIFHQGKPYVYKGTKLRPGEIMNLDVKALRDRQETGSFGTVLPPDFVTGRAALHFRPADNPNNAAGQGSHHETANVIGIASATTFDPKSKISFVDCVPQCPPEFYYGEVTQNAYWEGTILDTGFYIELTTYDAGGSMVNPDGLEVFWNNTGYSVTDTYGTYVQILAGGVSFPAGVVSAWGVYCFHSACNCGDWTPFFEIALFIQVAVPIPVNFRQHTASPEHLSNGTLRFFYRWDSSTGNLEHLVGCQIGEAVSYPGGLDPYLWPSPPWFANQTSPNPTIGWVTAVRAPNGSMGDNHFTRPILPSAQLTFGTFTTIQNYTWRCSYINNDAPNDWPAPYQNINIVRTVSSNGAGGWKYQVSKFNVNTQMDEVLTIDPLQ